MALKYRFAISIAWVILGFPSPNIALFFRSIGDLRLLDLKYRFAISIAWVILGLPSPDIAFIFVLKIINQSEGMRKILMRIKPIREKNQGDVSVKKDIPLMV